MVEDKRIRVIGEDKPTKVIDDNLLITKVFEHEIIMKELQREIEQLKRNIEKFECDGAKKYDNVRFFLSSRVCRREHIFAISIIPLSVVVD